MAGIWNLLYEIYTEFDRRIETCISEVYTMREQLFDSTKLVQTFFHSCGHSNVASNGHSTLRKLLMAIMDYHFVSSNSFWDWLATLHTIHHNPGKLLYTTDSYSSSKHQSQTGRGKHKDRHCMGIKTYRDLTKWELLSHVLNRGILWSNCKCGQFVYIM